MPRVVLNNLITAETAGRGREARERVDIDPLCTARRRKRGEPVSGHHRLAGIGRRGWLADRRSAGAGVGVAEPVVFDDRDHCESAF